MGSEKKRSSRSRENYITSLLELAQTKVRGPDSTPKCSRQFFTLPKNQKRNIKNYSILQLIFTKKKKYPSPGQKFHSQLLKKKGRNRKKQSVK